MNLLDQLYCFFAGGNTGRGDCDIVEGPTIGHLFLPASFVFQRSDTATEDAFRDAITALLAADNPRLRGHMIGTYQDYAANGENQVDDTAGFGNKFKVRDATISGDHTLYEGKTYHSLVKGALNGKKGQYRPVRITQQPNGRYGIWGVTRRDDDGNKVLGGAMLANLSVGNYMAQTGNTDGKFMVTVGYQNANEVDDNFAVVEVDFNPLELNGLITVNLSATSASATSIAVTALTAYKADMHELFASALAVVGGWSAKNATTGNPITISAVASNATGWTLTLAATGTDPDNPGSGGKVLLSMVVPSALAALASPVEGFESDVITVTLG